MEINQMLSRFVLGLVIAGILSAATTSTTFAEDAPKTKAECKKIKNMKWDSKTKACVKK
jgi:hypothetical protein